MRKRDNFKFFLTEWSRSYIVLALTTKEVKNQGKMQRKLANWDEHFLQENMMATQNGNFEKFKQRLGFLFIWLRLSKFFWERCERGNAWNSSKMDAGNMAWLDDFLLSPSPLNAEKGAQISEEKT